MFVKVDFGLDAVAYIRLTLSKASRLGLFLCKVDLERGTVRAFLPREASREELLHFAWAINDRTSLETGQVDWQYRQQEALFISNYLRASAEHLAIVQGLSYPPGREVKTLTPPYQHFAYKRVYPRGPDLPPDVITDVHYFHASQDNAVQLVQNLCEMADRFPYIGILTSAPEGAGHLESGQTIDDQTMEALAHKADHILVGAYDGDVTLIWSRFQEGWD